MSVARVLILALFASITISVSAAAAPARIRVQFEPRTRVSSAVRAMALTEAARVWQPYDILISDAAATPPCDGLTLPIVFDIDHQIWKQPADLGEIRFGDDGLPEPLITLFYRSLEKLAMSLDVRGAPSRYWTLAMHDEIVGRTLGRALAHEIGHFVLRWMHHAPEGLMRAEHHASALIDPSLGPFVLSGGDLARLAIVRAAAPSFVLPPHHQTPPLIAGLAAPLLSSGCPVLNATSQ